MSFNSRSEFTSAQTSEKVIIAHVHAKAQLFNWTVFAGNIYQKQLTYFPVDLKEKLSPLTQVTSIGGLIADTWFYETDTGIIYVNLDGTDPDTVEMVVKYRFFWANGPVTMSWDLTDAGAHVFYDGRIKESPAFKHKVGVDQKLVSVIGQGNLKLQNNDAELDEIYDTLFFENQEVEIYSWNRDLNFSDAKVVYRGKITNKIYNSTEVLFKVKDPLFDLLQNVPQDVYTDADNVNTDIQGRYKRWVYGRVDGLRLQSVDQIGDGYALTGTVSTTTPVKETTNFTGFPAASSFPASGTGAYFKINNAKDKTQYVYWYDVDNGNTQPALGLDFNYQEINVSASDDANTVAELTSVKLANNFTILAQLGSFNTQNTDFGETTDATAETSGLTLSVVEQGTNPEALNGVGTSFLSDTSPGDKISIGTQEFIISEVLSDTVLNLDNDPSYFFTGQTAILNPEIPTIVKNREFFVTGHACAELTKTVAAVKQFNRVTLSDTSGLNPGDFVEFATGERIEIRSIAPGNVIVLRQSMITLPSLGSNVIRQPIQSVFVESELVDDDKFTISNTGGSTNECKVTLDNDVEFQIASTENFGFDATFTNGTRDVTTTDDIDLTQILKPRDYIKPDNVAYTAFYEILSVSTQSLKLRTVFTDPTTTDPAEGKKPVYIGDDTVVSANILGKTVDGEPDGEWLQTSSDVVRDLLREINVTNINETSFTTAADNNSALVSLMIPASPSGGLETTKSVIDKLAKSTSSALTLDNDLNLQFTNLLPRVPDTPVEINDRDVIGWSIQSVSGELIRNTIVRYRHKDVDRFTLEAGNSTKSFSSDFVETFIGTNASSELDVYLYDDETAETMSHREIYFRSLSRAQITVKTDLRFEEVDIGDHLVVNFERLYKRFGDSTSRKKVCVVVGKTVTGDSMELYLSDNGNIVNRSSIITPNTAPDYATASEDEKLKYGYITDARGITNDDEDTTNINLIS